MGCALLHPSLQLKMLSEQDMLASSATKNDFLAEATTHMNAAAMAGDTSGPTEILSFLTRGVHQLASRQLEEAAASFDGVLSKSSHNTVALLGKVHRNMCPFCAGIVFC